MSLDEVYDRVDSVIKDMISLTNPNPVLNCTLSRTKYQSMGLTLLNVRSSYVTRDRDDHQMSASHTHTQGRLSSHLMVPSPADNLATLPNVHTLLISPSSDIGHNNLQDRREVEAIKPTQDPPCFIILGNKK